MSPLTPSGFPSTRARSEAGKWADVILVQGDPLADIRVLQQAERITSVIKSGRIVKGAAPGIPVVVGR